MASPSESDAIFLLLLEILREFMASEICMGAVVNLDAETMDLVCREAEENRIGPLFYFYCARLNVLPDSWKEKWGADFRAMSVAELRRADELENIYRILADRHIECAPLKGACLAYYYYPHPALRAMSDFDILIHQDDRGRAFQALVDHRFVFDYEVGRGHHHEAPLKSPRGSVVELHTHIVPDEAARCSHEALWRDSRSSEFRGQPITLLAPEIHLLHAVDHAFRDHLFCGIRAFTDAAYLFAAMDILSGKLEECAKKNGFQDELILFLNIFPDFFPENGISGSGQVPDGLADEARYLIRNFKWIQQMDRHSLMLHRDYLGLNVLKKILFLANHTVVKPSSVAEVYQCRSHSPMLAYYYIHRAFTSFIKLFMVEKTKNRNSLVRRIGVSQQKIHRYINGNTE